MKLTKQENSMVKVAAAYAAPYLIKKASLQDKLAAYGISLDKKASAKRPANSLQQKLAAYGIG